MLTNRGNVLNELVRQLKELNIDAERTAWKNFTGNLNEPSAVIVDISNAEQAVLVMKHIRGANILLQQHHHPIITVSGMAGWKDERRSRRLTWAVSDSAWEEEQRRTYNESYSVSATPGMVIVRFNPKFQNQVFGITDNGVICPAGMQIGDLDTRLAKLSEPRTVLGSSMIAKVSAVGLAGNGGHGTGRDEGSFSSQIRSIRTIDDRGNIRVIEQGKITTHFTDDKTGKITVSTTESFDHFDTIRAAHMGAFGLILSMELKTVPKFKLKEERTTYKSLSDLRADGLLKDRMRNNRDFTFMFMPVADKNAMKFEVRVWNKTDKPDQIKKPHYIAGSQARNMELSIRANKWINDCVYDNGLTKLLPLIQKIGAKVAIGTKSHTSSNPDVIVGDEHEIRHRQAVAFPEDLIDISLMFPIAEEKAAELLEWLVEKSQEILSSPEFAGISPVTYAMYARYFQGDNAGLSPSRTKPGQKILAFEWTTHPNAPMLDKFLQKMFTSINQHCMDNDLELPCFHPGKFIPARRGFKDYYGKEDVAAFNSARAAFYGDEKAANNSAFYTDYLREMLTRRAGSILPTNLSTIQESINRYKKPKHRDSNKTDEGFLEGLLGVPDLAEEAAELRRELRSARKELEQGCRLKKGCTVL